MKYLWFSPLSQALRVFKRTRFLSITIVLGISLATAANLAIFHIVHGLLFRTLPVPAPATLFEIVFHDHTGSQSYYPVPYYAVRQFIDRASDTVRIAAYSDIVLRTPVGTAAKSIPVQLVTDNYFSVLEIAASRGSLANFHAASDSLGIAISESFWKSHFHGSESAIGSPLELDGILFTVVAVVPEPFQGVSPYSIPQCWIPAAIERRLDRFATFTLIGRLPPNQSFSSPPPELQRTTAFLHESFGSSPPPAYKQYGRWPPELTVHLQHAALGAWGPRRGPRDTLYTLAAIFAAASLLLLLASFANTSTHSIIRLLQQARDIATRMALGASPRQVLLHLSAETLLLATLGILMGIALSSGVTLVLLHNRTDLQIASLNLNASLTIADFLAGAIIYVVLLSFLLVTIHTFVRRINISDILRGAQGRSPSTFRHFARNALLCAQFALATILLVASTLSIVTVAKLFSVSTGMNPDVVAATIDLDSTTAGASRMQAVSSIIVAIEGLPSVSAVSTSSPSPPLSGIYRMDPIRSINGIEMQSDRPLLISATDVGVDYFSVLGLKIVNGRAFSTLDSVDRSAGIVVNRTFASLYFPGEDPIGKFVGSSPIIGVCQDARTRNLWTDPVPEIFRLQNDYTHFSILVSPIHGGRVSPLDIRKVLDSSDAVLEVTEIVSLREFAARSANGRLLAAAIIAFVAIATCILAILSLSAFIIHALAERRPELGIRLAVGAAPKDIFRLVVCRFLSIAAIGATIGELGALVLMGRLSVVLFGISPYDPWVYIFVGCAVVSIGLVVSVSSTWKVAHGDALSAIRHV